MIIVPPILVLAASSGVMVDAQPASWEVGVSGPALAGVASGSVDAIAYEPMLASSAPVLVDDMPPLEYTYVELNYLWTDSDDLDESVSGAELIGSLELPLNFFAQVSASKQSGDADLTRYKIGAGYHLPVLSRFDLYGILSYVHAETDDTGDDFSDGGAGAELGARMLLTKRIEVNANARWADVGDDEFTIGAGARFYLLERLSVGGRIESLDGDPSLALGLRFEF